MKFVVAMFAAGLLLAGCSGSESDGDPKASPSKGAQAEQAQKAQEDLSKATAEKAAEASGKIVRIDIADGKATPQGDRVELTAGQRVRLVMNSDVAEEIHVHSDPEHTFQVKPGEPLVEEITLTRPGQVAVEAHHLGVTVVQLVVRP